MHTVTQMVCNPLACTLCFTLPCLAVTLPLPSDTPGSQVGSHLHPPPRLPQLPSPSCQPQQGASGECVGLWGWVGFPLSFLLWLSTAARRWASACPCQCLAGEFLPHSLSLTCACTSASGSLLYFLFCSLFGSGQSEEFKKQTARWTKASGRGVLQVRAHVHESRRIERQICLTAQVNLGYRMQVPAYVSNPEAVE